MSAPQGGRGRRGRGYTLITPDNQYVSRLPSLPGARFVKLVTPRLAPARFAQYLIDGAPDGSQLALDPAHEHFVYGLKGTGTAGGFDLSDEGYAYLPPGAAAELTLAQDARALLISRPYEPWPGLEAPHAHGGKARSITETPTVVDGLMRRELIDPLDPAFDFNISLLRFEPDVGLHQIEIHDEEHGLYMTAGGGTYGLDDDMHEVHADDFIYMAPYCPQWFGSGADGGEYLLYKDVYRTGF